MLVDACAGLGGAWDWLSCTPRPAATTARLGALVRGTGHTEDSYCLFGVNGPLRDSRKVHSAAQTCVEKLLKDVQARLGSWVGQGLGIPWAGVGDVSQVNGALRCGTCLRL